MEHTALSRPLSMVDRASELRDDVFELCAAFSKRARAGKYVPYTAEFRAIIVELRLLGGVLHSFHALLCELQEDGGQGNEAGAFLISHEPPLWFQLDKHVEVLHYKGLQQQDFHSSKELQSMRSALSTLRSQLGLVIGSSQTMQDVAAHLTILALSPSDDDPTPESRFYGPESAKTTPEAEWDKGQVVFWLDLLNAPEYGVEPAEYVEEAQATQTRRQNCPDYDVAAVGWPKFAEKHWGDLQNPICSLFGDNKHFNFVRWVLQYARGSYPGKYGPGALSHKPLVELTDVLCYRSVSPLHIAAALELPSLCEHLLAHGADPNQPSLLGPPLYCAMMGPLVFDTREEPYSWACILERKNYSKDCAKTVVLLMEAGADCSYRYRWKSAEDCSLAALAFFVALNTGEESIFEKIIGVSDFSGAQALMRGGELAIRRDEAFKRRFVRLLTRLCDYLLKDADSMRSDTFEVAWELLIARRMGLICAEGAERVPVDDDRFQTLVWNSILDSEMALFKRLMRDPRFHPDMSYDKKKDQGTVLHLAAEGSQFEILDLLLEAGANLSARDATGRTPLMVAEEIYVLSKLVLEYGASTSDVNSEGRNIWHMAAATNESKFIQWLCEHDPLKDQNMVALSNDGRTPLVEAFFFINSLKGMPNRDVEEQPKAALLLLEEGRGRLELLSDNRLPQLAVQWGSLDLLSALTENIMPEGLFAEGKSLLHHLNLSATDELIDKVLTMCEGLPIQDSKGLTPAETIFSNTCTLQHYAKPREGFKKSGHPSCYIKLSKDAYDKLLTPEVLASRDSRDRGLWARFCDHVIPMMSASAVNYEKSMTHFLSDTVNTAVACMARKGALADYERQTDMSVISRMSEASVITARKWPGATFGLIRVLLDLLPEESMKRLLQEEESSYSLLAQSVRLGETRVLRRLLKNGFDLYQPRYGDGMSVIERLLKNQLDLIKPSYLDILLTAAGPDFWKRSQAISQLILKMPPSEYSVALTDMLLRKGFNPQQIVTSDRPKGQRVLALLPELICQGKTDIAQVLIEEGSAISFGPFGYNAVMAAVETGRVAMLEKLIDAVPADFAWDFVYDLPSLPSYNVLQMAAARGHHEILRKLLSRPSVRKMVNDVTDRNHFPPIHLAIKSLSLECLQILGDYEANLEILDGNQSSPLYLALRWPNHEAVDWLISRHVNTETDRSNITLLTCLRPIPNMAIQSRIEDKLNADPFAPFEKPSPRALGRILDEVLESSGVAASGIITSALTYVLKEDIENAIFPCEDCTLLSLAAIRGQISVVVEAVNHDICGFFTGCSAHWPEGFNSLDYTFFCFRHFVDRNLNDAFDHGVILAEKLLDVYLQNSWSWLRLPVTPLHHIASHLNASAKEDLENYERILCMILKHLRTYASKYWKLIPKMDLPPPPEGSSDETTADKVVRYAINLPCRQSYNVTYTGGANCTALHVLLDRPRCDEEIELPDAYIRIVRRFIDEGADINAQDDDLKTPIHLAARCNDIQVIKELCNAGADLNMRDREMATALSHAVGGCRVHMAQYLVQQGADIGAYSEGSHHYLFTSDTPAMLFEYFQLGVDAHQVTHGRGSVLSRLIASGPATRTFALNTDFDFYRLAEESPPFLNILVNNQHSTISRNALSRTLRRIPQEARAKAVNKIWLGGPSPVSSTIRNGDLASLRVLLDFGLDLDSECCTGDTALVFACSIGALESVKLLVRGGAKLLYLGKGPRGETVVRSALDTARLFPKIRQWLLVGRFQDQPRLEWNPSSTGEAAVVKPWSGPRKAIYQLIGAGNECLKRYPSNTEDHLEQLRRKSLIRRELAGQVVPISFVEGIGMTPLDLGTVRDMASL